LNLQLRTLKGEGVAGTQRRGEGDEAQRVEVVVEL
jgi:hypothetical protein